MKPPSELPSQPVHLVVRYSNQVFSGIDTIARHQEVVGKHGYVWFGKLGRTVKTEVFQKQLDQAVPTFLYFTGGETARQILKGRILAIRNGIPKEKTEAIPPYYFDFKIPPRVNLWTLIADLNVVPDSEWRSLITKSSLRPISESVRLSSVGAFVVIQRPPRDEPSSVTRRKALKSIILESEFCWD